MRVCTYTYPHTHTHTYTHTHTHTHTYTHIPTHTHTHTHTEDLDADSCPPRRILFIKEITSFLMERLPDFCKLDQAYYTGSLFQVRRHSEQGIMAGSIHMCV